MDSWGGRSDWVALGGAGGWGGAGDWDNAGGDDNAAIQGDTELGGVLVLAGHIINDLNTVAVGASGGLEVGRRSPGEATAVGDTLGERRTELDNVGGRALQEKDGDGVGSGWLPSDGERLAGWDNLFMVSAVLGLFRSCLACAESCCQGPSQHNLEHNVSYIPRSMDE